MSLHESIADVVTRLRCHIRILVETIHPPKPCVFTECGEKDCKANAAFVLIDKSIGLRVYVCVNHYIEIRDFRDWDIEST